MPRKRGKDSNKHKQAGGRKPKATESQTRKRERNPRSKEETQRDRDPDAVERSVDT